VVFFFAFQNFKARFSDSSSEFSQHEHIIYVRTQTSDLKKSVFLVNLILCLKVLLHGWLVMLTNTVHLMLKKEQTLATM